MRRRQDIQSRQLIGVIVLGMLAARVTAGIWPSWESPMQGGFDRGDQALSAAVERLTVVAGPWAWTNYASTNIWSDYFKQRTKLHAAKQMLKAAHSYYIMPITSYTPGMETNWTEATLTAHVGAPASWWTNTPGFNLAADSNGYRFFPAIASNLVMLKDYYPQLAASNTTALFWYSTSVTSMDDAYDQAVALGPTNIGIWTYDFTSAETREIPGGGPYDATLMKHSSQRYWNTAVSFAIYPGERQFIGVIYGKAAPALNGFDAQGDNVDTNYLHYLTWTNDAGGSSPLFSPFANPTSPPPNHAENAVRGWSMDDTGLDDTWWILYRFNDVSLTNGFRWFK